MRDDIVNPQLESSRTCRTMEQRERNGRPLLFNELRFQFTLCLFNTILIKAYPAGLRMRTPYTLVCQNSFIQWKRRVGANSARGTKEIGKARRVFGSYDRRRSVWRPLRLFSSPLARISVTRAKRIRETFFHPPGRGESLRESHGDRGRASVAPGEPRAELASYACGRGWKGEEERADGRREVAPVPRRFGNPGAGRGRSRISNFLGASRGGRGASRS